MLFGIITKFEGEHRFLSNFYAVKIEYAGLVYPTVEHAYQAAKSDSVAERMFIARAETPGKAKKIGKMLALRPDWESVKDNVMLALLFEKFEQPDLAQRLLNTGESLLIEGNTWGDKYWGVCDGEGLNKLGKLLMFVRDHIRNRKETL